MGVWNGFLWLKTVKVGGLLHAEISLQVPLIAGNSLSNSTTIGFSRILFYFIMLDVLNVCIFSNV
jgi:hypothetical protein